MGKFDVFQLNIADNVYEDVNKYGHDGAVKRHDIWNTRLDLTLSSDRYHESMFRFYRKVAVIEANSLEDVFSVGNMGPEDQIQRIHRMHSLSVGDIVKDEKGQHHFVDVFGFKAIEVPSAKGLKISEEHFDILHEAVLKAMEHNPNAKYRYEHGDFANADRVKDLQKRLCFDTLYLATDHFAPLGFMSDLYEYLDDTHIYSALKRMCPPVEMKYDPAHIKQMPTTETPSP